MNLYHLPTLSLCIILPLAGCVAPEEAQEPTPLQDKEDPQGRTQVRGLARYDDGSPASNANVYIISKTSDARLFARTNDLGEFSWPEAFVGEASLVINDHKGFGHIKDLIIFAGGTLEVGTLTLAPLERFAQLVELTQIGYEERITKEAGDYQHPVYNASATKVYAVRRLEGQARWTLVEIDTSSGQETILERDILLDTTKEEIGTLPLSLHHDRYVLYYDKEDGPCLHDPIAQKTIFRGKDHNLDSKLWWPALSNDKRILFFESLEVRPKENSFGGGKFRWHLRGYDWTQDKIVETPQLPATDWLSQPTIYYNKQNKAVVGIHPITRDNSTEPPQDLNGSRTHIYAIDLDNLRPTLITKFPLSTLLPQGQDKLILSNVSGEEELPYGEFKTIAASISSLDLNTLHVRTILTQDINSSIGRSIVLGAVDPQGLKAAYWVVDGRRTSQMMQLDLQTEQSTPVDLSYEPGLDLSCSDWECKAQYNQAGELQVFATIKRGDDLRGVFTELSSSTKTSYEIDLTDNTKEAKLWWNMLERAPSKMKIFSWRVPETGFFQLYTNDPAAPQAAPIQRTFLPGHHEHFKLSLDGQQLYYFTVDPLSGHTQLFRLRLNTPQTSP